MKKKTTPKPVPSKTGRKTPPAAGTTRPAAGGGAETVISTLPPDRAQLTAGEVEELLGAATMLKRLGVDPVRIMRNQSTAEVAVRFLRLTEAASVPDLLRRMVESPLVSNSSDALDAPSVRTHLKRARGWRKYVGRERDHDEKVRHAHDLDRCADAFRLAPSRGGQTKALFEVLVDQMDYLTYLRMKIEFAAQTGTSLPKRVASADQLRIAELEAILNATDETDNTLSSVDPPLVDPAVALARQVKAFKAEIGTAGALSPAERCALALWEFKVGSPATETQLPAAKAYVARLQRDLRLLKGRSLFR